MINALTVDVEDYFHPSEVQPRVSSAWETLPSRVESAMSRVLDLLAEQRVHATCFVLGWVAERHPRLVRAMAAQGHEIACHSYAHQLVFDLSPEAFRADTARARMAIEDACGVSPMAYRAPSYSITLRCMWALEILVENGFRVDSSIYPIAHDRYGIPGFARHAVTLTTPSGPIMEIPAATVELSRTRIAPVGGGAYLRLLPYRYTAAGIRRINLDEGRPACIYFHPWEIDPGQPRLLSGWISRARTYTGLRSMEAKLTRLMKEFQFSTMSTAFLNS
jgi:polysaccharide deacetylase family protein (PEP-CTERM system associated)